MKSLIAMSIILASLSVYANGDDYLKRIIIETSEYKKNVIFRVSYMEQGRYNWKPEEAQTLFSSMDKKTGIVNSMVQFSNIYAGSWKNWIRASTNTADERHVYVVSRDVIECPSDCVYQEIVNINLRDGDLLSFKNGSLSIMLFSKDGNEQLIAVPADIASDQLKAIENYAKEMNIPKSNDLRSVKKK